MSHSFDALWIGCGDGRLRTGRNLEMEKMGLRLVDIPAPPGGALGLVFKEIDPHGETLRQAKIYAGLHNPSLIVLEAHLDCGAVKKILGRTFVNEEDEQNFLMQELQAAKSVMEKNLTGIPVKCILSKPVEGAFAYFSQAV